MTVNSLSAMLDLLLPPVCLICGSPRAWSRPLGEALCPECSAELVPDGRRPAPVVGLRVLSVAAVTRHTGVAARAVEQLKFRNRTGLGRVLGRRMASVMPDPDIDAVVPVPMHPVRLAQRPVSQSVLLAHGLAEARRERPRVCSLLERVDPAPPRTVLGAAARRRQRPVFRLRRGVSVEGRRVVLVDDVATTGITLITAADRLWRSGAAAVSAVVVSSRLDEG